MLGDADGALLRVWDERGVAQRAKYDALRRPTHLYVTPPVDSEFLAERTVYGDALGASAATLNLRGAMNMMTITISDRNAVTNVLSFDLKDLLAILSEDGERSKWTVNGAEVLGRAAEELYAVQSRRERQHGAVLRQLAEKLEQVIEGEFRAYGHDEDANPWLILRATDSSSWDVASNRNDVLDRFRVRFREVREAGNQSW